ncbi:MAG: DnaJ domain-containing protein [Bacteriovorax sp.]|nr:DnaJ domain-containing protein [Bacteriovorax sp.]
MPLNKDIIIRVVIGIIFFVIFVKVVGPVIFEVLKGKLPGSKDPDNNIDHMIKGQKERLRAQYGITGKEVSSTSLSINTSGVEAEEKSTPAPTKEIEAIYKETRWGGGEFAKSIQNEIAKNYSYTLTETKVNSFIMLAEKRHYLRYLSSDNQKNQNAIKNYLGLVMLNLILIEEIRSKEFNLLDRVAKKCHVSSQEFLIALQLKILFTINSKREIKEERIFSEVPSLHQYSEDTIKEAFISILKKEANLWAKGHSHYYEELSLYLNYADIMVPLPRSEHKKDLLTSYTILKADEDMETEEIKKLYKKMAMLKHPDKIGQMKLPKTLEKKAINNFNQIQEAYDIIMTHRKK